MNASPQFIFWRFRCKVTSSSSSSSSLTCSAAAALASPAWAICFNGSPAEAAGGQTWYSEPTLWMRNSFFAEFSARHYLKIATKCVFLSPQMFVKFRFFSPTASPIVQTLCDRKLRLYKRNMPTVILWSRNLRSDVFKEWPMIICSFWRTHLILFQPEINQASSDENCIWRSLP